MGPRTCAHASAAIFAAALLIVTGATTAMARPAPSRPKGALPVVYAGPAVHTSSLRSPSISPNAATSVTGTSRNWAGYAAYPPNQTTPYNKITATWVQPAMNCAVSGAGSEALFWVGFDGWLNDTVEQGGTFGYCNGTSTPQYTVWWEMYPTNAIQGVFNISAGDKITASVNYLAPQFVITVKDDTTGKSFTQSETCDPTLTCQRNTAEVIAEVPGFFGTGGYYQLADYGTVNFSAVSMHNKSGKTGTFINPNWVNAAITESASGITYATVSPLNKKTSKAAAGSAFSATWKHS